MTDHQLSTLDAKLKEYCTNEKISGVLRVTVKDEILYQADFGYANDQSKTEFTANSMFTFYSMSKPFCAIGLLKLKEKGLVDLDVHPKTYLPEANGFHDKVTVRHLLHHVSGLPDFEQNVEFSSRYKPGTKDRVREHLKLLAEYPSYFEPNTDAKYANINFIIPALMIENVTGVDYADYMKKEVFQPLGMKHAVVDNEKRFIENRVQGYAIENGVRVPIEKSHNWLFGAGDMVGTVDDAYCLNTAYKNKPILSNESWKEIITPSPLSRMGLGNTISIWHGKKRITHNGGHLGFRTLHVQLPEDDFDMILLSNSGYGNARRDIAEMVYQAFYNENGAEGEGIEMDKGYL